MKPQQKTMPESLPPASTKKWTNEALANVLWAHRLGTQQIDLARSFGLSRSRMQQVIAKAKRLEQSPASPLDALSCRARNCLRCENLHTAKEIRAAMESGRLKKVPNFGRLTKLEVLRWLESLPKETP